MYRAPVDGQLSSAEIKMTDAARPSFTQRSRVEFAPTRPLFSYSDDIGASRGPISMLTRRNSASSINPSTRRRRSCDRGIDRRATDVSASRPRPRAEKRAISDSRRRRRARDVGRKSRETLVVQPLHVLLLSSSHTRHTVAHPHTHPHTRMRHTLTDTGA